MASWVYLFAFFFVSVFTKSQINLLPYPKQVEVGQSIIRIPRCALSFYSPESFAETMNIHKDLLFANTNKCGSIMNNQHYPVTIKKLESDTINSEYYELSITETGVDIIVYHHFGLVRALTTFSQILSLSEYSHESYLVKNAPIIIKDEPRFSYRGLMIDTSRHFLQVSTIKRVINSMMLAKLNVLHWHLVDDDSFPMQSKHIPGLAENATFSSKEMYTVDEIKGIVDYAKNRGVRVIPEIDTPGHSRSPGLFAPLNHLLTCFNSVWPYRLADYYRIHGGPPTAAFDPSLDGTYKFMENILKDLLEYFPDELVHLGGDEVLFSCWRGHKTIEEFMKKHGIKDYTELMTYYISKVRTILANLSQNKRAVYWSDPATFSIRYSENDILQYWGNSKSLPNLTTLYPHNSFILSPNDYCYLNCGLGNKYGSGASWCGEYKTWLKMYLFEPTNYTIPKEKILGAEACAWGEANTDYNIDLKLWPRMAAFAENLWSNKEEEVDLAGLVKRLNDFSRKLNEIGIPTNPVTSQYCEIHTDECFSKNQLKSDL
eukprot:TRINITY_DN375_c0_g1_i4.p1 TRINITY_DN375_c0_g1~~TRINITY_DN375_c0_g1_i4.p1  ORF type:complete len:544 (-),score=33.68 TRINITY_DN375_c0_g1_i4:51-1682(-)